RDRNWFKVNWNLAAVKLKGDISNKTAVDLRVFGLMAERQALGFLGLPNRVDDPDSPRDLIRGKFENIGAEARLLHRFTLAGKRNIALIGFRAYHGNTDSKQGRANTTDRPEFYYQNIDALEGSDYQFDNMNYAIFLEDVFYISNRMTVTPGLRMEFIDTRADGYYTTTVTDQVGNVIERTETPEQRARARNFALAGIGWSFKMTETVEVYANVSQNYRAINFSDIRIQNPSLRIDPNIRDERGFNTDLGFRGGTKRIHYDVSGYYLSYRDRIGAIQRRDPETFQFYRLRTNIADSYAIGAEGYLEGVIYSSKEQGKCNISAFANASFTEARYTAPNDNTVDGNRVELTPQYTFRSGLRGKFSDFSITLQVSRVGDQFTDATNAVSTPSSINGVVPAYTVADFSAAYQWKRYRFEFGVNNFTNEKYFTRRAVGYPGPGIIPSDGIGGYLTIEARF
ncbi:MAG TPA: TonB-dependent receptor, partial [Cryomorphaceae bacterium]|nr:TonB-dependent receptor [Cryomorphaceae bacterium]